MKSTALVTTNLGDFSVTISPDAQQQKDDALSLASVIKTVANTTEQQDALAAAGICKALVSGMEKTRVSVKEPVLAAGRIIDAKAKEYATELQNEVTRLEGVAGMYQAQVNAAAAKLRAEEEEHQRVASAELERQRQEDLREAQRREQEANAARLADLERIQSAKDDEARQQAQQATDEAAEARARQVREQELHDAEMAEHRAEEARQRAMTMATMAPPKVENARTRVSFDYELVDISALYRARPDLVKLTEKRADILTAINIPGQPPPAGIRVFESTKMSAKALA